MLEVIPTIITIGCVWFSASVGLGFAIGRAIQIRDLTSAR